MAAIRFVALSTDVADAYRQGALDANGQRPERRISDGSGLPCRHCLGEIAAGEEYLVLAHRPFTALQAFAESGPIFLHADACMRYPETSAPPAGFLERPAMMLRGYDVDERIVYGTGVIVPSEQLVSSAAAIVDHPNVAFVHARSATNGCFQCRIDPGAA